MKTSMDDILNGFDPLQRVEKSGIKDGAPIAIWLPPDYKTRYDAIQEKSGRQFGKKLREIIKVAIDQVEKAS